MGPFVIAPVLAAGIGLRLSGVAFEPAAHIVVIRLLAPQQAGKGLPLHAARVSR